MNRNIFGSLIQHHMEYASRVEVKLLSRNSKVWMINILQQLLHDYQLLTNYQKPSSLSFESSMYAGVVCCSGSELVVAVAMAIVVRRRRRQRTGVNQPEEAEVSLIHVQCWHYKLLTDQSAVGRFSGGIIGWFRKYVGGEALQRGGRWNVWCVI